MTMPGCVTCETCGADYIPGQPHRCEPEPLPRPISPAAIPSAPATPLPAVPAIDAAPDLITDADPSAPQKPRSGSTTPIHAGPLGDLDVLTGLGTALDEDVGNIFNLTPEQEADCVVHRDTDSLAGLLLRRIAHMTGNRDLLDRCNAEAADYADAVDLEAQPLTLPQIAGRIAAITTQLMRGTIDPPRARATLYALQTAAVALKMQGEERTPPPCPPPLLIAESSASNSATPSVSSASSANSSTADTSPKRDANKYGKRGNKRSAKSARRSRS